MPTQVVTAIDRLTQAISTSESLSDIYEAALDGISEALGVSRASILLFDPDGVMRFKAWRGISSDYRAAVEGHTPWRPGDPATEPIVVGDVQTDASLAGYLDVFARERIRSLAFVPLVSEGRVIGKFMLYRDVPSLFTADDVRAAKTIGALVGFAVERTRASGTNARLYEEAQHALAQEASARERITLLADGAPLLLASVTTESVVGEVLALARQLIDADAYAVWRKEGDDWHIVGSAGVGEEFAGLIRPGVPSFVFREPIVASDLASWPLLDGRRSPYEAEGICSLMSVPLLVRGDADGSIAFYYRTPHEPTQIELRVAVALGHIAAAAINNAELHREQQRLRRDAEAAERRAAFLAAASASLSSLDYEENLRRVARLAVPDLCDWCVIDLVEEDGTVKRVAMEHTEELKEQYPTRLSEKTGLRRVLRTGKPELVENVIGVSMMIVPLAVGERTIGALTFLSVTSGRTFTRSDLAFAGELARRAGLAVENARLYREAQAANRLKDLFLATLSHELRTPLNVMIGRTRMLRTAGSLEAVLQIADILERNGAALRRLVDDLLDISRMAQGHVALDVHPLQLDALVGAVVHSVQPTAHAKGLTMQAQIAPGLPSVNGDAVRLQQVVWNVLSNAVKFTETGGEVSVTLTLDDQDVVLVVSDSGIGIDPVFLPHVFDMFTQEDSTHSRTHGGLGLGLSIVRRLVELHGGHVSAMSDGPGHGSTFTIRLPSATVTSGVGVS